MRLSHLEQLQYFEDLAEGRPEWYPATLIRVMGGESLKDIAAGYACLGVVLREWIKRDDDREIAYQDALEKKREIAGEELLDSTIAAARATVQDAQSSSGEWLDVAMWPPGLLKAADTVEFGADGRVFKIKADVGRSKDRLGRMLGLDKTGQNNVNLAVSLVSVLSGMPPAQQRLRPGDTAKQIASEPDAGEEAQAATPAGTLLLDNPPRQAVRVVPATEPL